MKFKVTLRNKITAEIVNNVYEADNEADARYENEADGWQILSVRPLRLIGEKPQSPEISPYVSIKRLRARQERDLCNRQMKLGKYSPEAIKARTEKEQAEIRKEMEQELGE